MLRRVTNALSMSIDSLLNDRFPSSILGKADVGSRKFSHSYDVFQMIGCVRFFM